MKSEITKICNDAFKRRVIAEKTLKTLPNPTTEKEHELLDKLLEKIHNFEIAIV